MKDQRLGEMMKDEVEIKREGKREKREGKKIKTSGKYKVS